jgi:hypothetical protein
MRKLLWKLSAGALILGAAACGRGGDPDALTAEENRQLDNTAEMLDASPDNLVPAGNAELGNGDEPAMDATGEEPDEAVEASGNVQ